MSTKSHIISNVNLEIFSEVSEPQSIFGTFTGYNIYMIIENTILKSFKIKDEYLYIEVKEGYEIPPKLKIWGGNVLECDWNSDGLTVLIKGGSYTAKEIEKLNFESIINKSN